VARFEWTSGISRDPVVTFSLKADREGPLTMTWKDNKGGVYTQTANIAFAAA
jgi:sulfur-oxidizing protein SoxZ